MGKAIKKLESIYKAQGVDKLTMQRQYLPEIFSADLLEISKDDGIPIIKQSVLGQFWLERISIISYNTEVQFLDERTKKKRYPMMVNPHEVMKPSKVRVKQAVQDGEKCLSESIYEILNEKIEYFNKSFVQITRINVKRKNI